MVHKLCPTVGGSFSAILKHMDVEQETKDDEISKLESIEEWLELGERGMAMELIEELKDRNIKEIARSLL